MYTSFTIKNFRLFDDITIEPLARVNLIAGDNNVGKTALLEALWIHANSANPRRAAAISNQRGLPISRQPELLADWFPRYQTDLTAQFKAQGNWGDGCRLLKVHRREREYQEHIYATEQSETDFDEIASNALENDHEVVFGYENENGEQAFSNIWSVGSRAASQSTYGVGLKKDQKSGSRNSIRCEFVRLFNRERHLRFSEIARHGYLSDAEEIIRQIEPKLQLLTLIANDRGAPVVYGKVGNGEFLPMTLLGDGTNRLLDMVLGFLPARHGIILIDEIENGIHHDRLEQVWKNIEQLSKKFNVQVFATTHSYECIVAAHNTFTAVESDELHLHRLYRKNEQVKSVTYTKKMLNTNIEYFWELR